MKKHIPRLTAALAALALMLAATPAAQAAGASASIGLSGQAIYEGESFTLTLTFTSDSEAISAINAKLAYDDGLLTYISGGGNSVELSGGTGGIEDTFASAQSAISYTLKFMAKKAGSAVFAIKSSEIVGAVSGRIVGSPAAKASVAISPKAAASAQPTESAGTEPETELIEAALGDKRMYIVADLADIALPEGFSAAEINIGGKPAHCAKNASGAIMLVYAFEETGGADFYIYDNALICRYIPIGGAASYVLAVPEEAPEDAEAVSLNIGGRAAPAAWRDSKSGLYIVYAADSGGEKGFYYYDAAENTLFAVTAAESMAASPSAPVPSSLPASSADDAQNNAPAESWLPIAVICAGVLCLVLIVLNILIAAAKRKKAAARSDDYIE